MNPVKAIIVDDEEHNRQVLRTLLKTYCSNILIIGEAKDTNEAFGLIKLRSPQLVFLDVKMPGKSGFDLLKMFNEALDFEVIFVSAFNEYAVTAFEYNALGYILKPIDYNKLISAVNKAILKIGLNTNNNSVIQFIKTLEKDTDVISKIAIHHNEKVVLVNIADIISIRSYEGICNIDVINNKQYHSARDLKLFEGVLRENVNFTRISKNTILNLNHLKSYKKGDICILQMNNNSEFEVSRRKKTEVLQRIKVI